MSVEDKTLLTKKFTFDVAPKPIRKLALRGGGAKGIVYGGAIEVLEEKGILRDVDTIAGSSAGALTALMVAIGMTSKEITKAINETNFNQFKDYEISKVIKGRGLCSGDKLSAHIQQVIKDNLPKRIDSAESIIRDGIVHNLKLLKKELYLKLSNEDLSKEDKESTEEFLAQIINYSVELAQFISDNNTQEFNATVQKINRRLRSDKTTPKPESCESYLRRLTDQWDQLQKINRDEITFEDLKLLNACLGNCVKRLVITGTNLTLGRLDLFSDETTPNMPISIAARISASFPLVFQAVDVEQPKGGVYRYIDGGVGDNLPVRQLLSQRKDDEFTMGRTEKIGQTLSFQFQQPKVESSTGLIATIRNFLKYLASGRIDVAANSAELMDALKNDFSERVINLPVDIDTLDFDVSLAKKQQLQQGAKVATEASLAIKRTIRIEGDILECFLAMSQEELEKIDPKTVDPEHVEAIHALKTSVLAEKSNSKTILYSIVSQLRIINTMFAYSIQENDRETIRDAYTLLLDLMNRFVVDSIHLDGSNSLPLEEKHKKILYQKLKDIYSLEFMQLSANINAVMGTGSEELQEIFKNTGPAGAHNGFFADLRLAEIKREALSLLIKAKVKPFQLQSNVTLLEKAVEKLRDAKTCDEVKGVLAEVQDNYYRRNLLSITLGTSRFFKGSPDTSTAKEIATFIEKIDTIPGAKESPDVTPMVETKV